MTRKDILKLMADHPGVYIFSYQAEPIIGCERQKLRKILGLKHLNPPKPFFTDKRTTIFVKKEVEEWWAKVDKTQAKVSWAGENLRKKKNYRYTRKTDDFYPVPFQWSKIKTIVMELEKCLTRK